jgi:large subunit ribosomal protein L24
MALNIKKNDTVLVLSGKDKGKKGRVLQAYPSERLLLVEGVNIVKKHKKPDQRNQSGGIVSMEAPIPACKVMLVHPQTGLPVRVTRQRVSGKPSVRVSAKDRSVIA